ncbi:MAG: DNA polymerase III subunit gamma/tau [Chlamydiales bacterium]
MPSYKILARKYRPQLFCDVVEQESIVTTLKHAILLNRSAHAYLFCGCHGTGKTTLARLFAKALNCPKRSKECEPCNQCSSCKEISNGQAIDVLEIDGASHRGIEDIRQINETLGFAPIGGRYKIYLIDEVHMLTKEAFNALLKTLEEPPKHVKFFFATTEPHKIPTTVLSRCQRFNLNRIPPEKIKEKLRSIAADMDLSVEEDALSILSELAEGSLRDAESLFDQVITFQEGPISAESVTEVFGLPTQQMFFALDEAGAQGKWVAAFEMAEQIFSSGKNITYFVKELTTHFRTLFLMKNKLSTHGRNQQQYQQSVSLYREEQLIQILELLTEAEQMLKLAPSKRTALEMLLLRILRTHQLIGLESLVQRLVDLEKQVSRETAESKEKKSPKAAPPKAQNHQESHQVPSQKNQCHHDTLMQFAAKELNGPLKKGN